MGEAYCRCLEHSAYSGCWVSEACSYSVAAVLAAANIRAVVDIVYILHTEGNVDSKKVEAGELQQKITAVPYSLVESYTAVK